jgi:hypothetical protein
MSKCGNLGVSQSRNDSVTANGSIERSQQMGIPKKAAVPILNGRCPSTNVKCEVGLQLLNCGNVNSCTRQLAIVCLGKHSVQTLSHSWDFEISCSNRIFIWLLSFVTMVLFIVYSIHIRIYTYRGTTCNHSVHMSAVTKGKSAHNQHLASKVHTWVHHDVIRWTSYNLVSKNFIVCMLEK